MIPGPERPCRSSPLPGGGGLLARDVDLQVHGARMKGADELVGALLPEAGGQLIAGALGAKAVLALVDAPRSLVEEDVVVEIAGEGPVDLVALVNGEALRVEVGVGWDEI